MISTMKTPLRIVGSCFAVLALSLATADCAPAASESESMAVPPATPVQVAPARAIAGLQLRDKKLTIFSTDKGLAVTVVGEGGQVVADAVPIEKLRNVDPFLYDVCVSTVASTGGPYVDASLHLPPRPTIFAGVD
jgi:hypothetical protein